jgi:hypothetical protein
VEDLLGRGVWMVGEGGGRASALTRLRGDALRRFPAEGLPFSRRYCPRRDIWIPFTPLPSGRGSGRHLRGRFLVARMVRIHVSGGRNADARLVDWLRKVDELRGQVHRVPRQAEPDDMGAGADLVVALASTSAATALVTSLQVWLTNRHSDVDVTVVDPNGGKVEFKGKRVHDFSALEVLLLALLQRDRERADPPAPGDLAGDEEPEQDVLSDPTQAYQPPDGGHPDERPWTSPQ